jgi:16S rRNA processing protein RimM
VNWDDMAVVGRVARPHGIRGQVILNAETDFPEERFQAGGELFIDRRHGVEPLRLTTVRFHRGRPIVGVSGIESIDAAQELVGLELRVPADRLVPLPAGTFYCHDLVGCRVETGAGTAVGIVKDVDGTFAASRLVVASDGDEILIPLVSQICREIDAAGKRIVIDPPEGLLELNRVNGNKSRDRSQSKV